MHFFPWIKQEQVNHIQTIVNNSKIQNAKRHITFNFHSIERFDSAIGIYFLFNYCTLLSLHWIKINMHIDFRQAVNVVFFTFVFEFDFSSFDRSGTMWTAWSFTRHTTSASRSSEIIRNKESIRRFFLFCFC